LTPSRGDGVFLNPPGSTADAPGMHRIQLGKRLARARLRRPLALLAVVGIGLLTALAAAQIAAGPNDPEALERTIAQQRIQGGVLVGAEPIIEHQEEPHTPGQMLDLSGQYEADMRKALDHGETMRVVAYRSRDIIRMTCIDDRLNQIRTVIRVVEPRFTTIHMVKRDVLTMRGQFSVIHQAWERVRVLTAQIEACLGDTLDLVTGGRIDEEATTPNDVNDPTRPQESSKAVDRPPEASTYQ
jgi:hypothetical protein